MLQEKRVVESCVSRYVPSHRRQASPKFVPTCHYGGKVGQIQPNYFKLNPSDFVSIRVRIPILE
jgi:hypothetical protein